MEELWTVKNDIPEDHEEKTLDSDPTKKTSFFPEFEISKDRKSLTVTQNRVVIILDINKSPTSMIWAFDFKPYKSGLVQHCYDRKFGRVFAVMKNGTVACLGKDKEQFDISLRDHFGKSITIESLTRYSRKQPKDHRHGLLV